MGMPVDKPLTYLDNAATTPPYPEVLARMHEVMMDGWGNPSSPHVVGRRAKEMFEESRATIADVLGVDADEIYFTSGSTESNNLAIRGACLAQRANPGKIITSTLEHSSVTRTVRGMRRDLDWDCRYVDAPDGCFDMEQLAEQLQDGPTSLISVMRVQNETGWIFPVPEIAQLRDELPARACRCIAMPRRRFARCLSILASGACNCLRRARTRSAGRAAHRHPVCAARPSHAHHRVRR